MMQHELAPPQSAARRHTPSRRRAAPPEETDMASKKAAPAPKTKPREWIGDDGEPVSKERARFLDRDFGRPHPGNAALHDKRR